MNKGDGGLVYIFTIMSSEFGRDNCPGLNEGLDGLGKLFCNYIRQDRVFSEEQLCDYLHGRVKPIYENYCEKRGLKFIPFPKILKRKRDEMVRKRQEAEKRRRQAAE
jgi:hypothetical protein